MGFLLIVMNWNSLSIQHSLPTHKRGHKTGNKQFKPNGENERFNLGVLKKGMQIKSSTAKYTSSFLFSLFSMGVKVNLPWEGGNALVYQINLQRDVS